jgi:hypothetical protein
MYSLPTTITISIPVAAATMETTPPTTAAARTTSPWTRFLWFCLINGQCAALQFVAIKALDCCLRLIFVRHFNKSESSGTAGKFIHNNIC